MKIYMKNAGIMNTSNRGFSSNLGAVPLDAKKQDKSYASVGEYKTKQSNQVTLNSSNMVGLGLANNDKIMALNIKKKKSKNISFEL